MPNQRTISANQLTPGNTAAIHGYVTFSRIRARVEGDALKRENARLTAAGRPTRDKPYTSISIRDASIVPSQPNGPNGQPQMTPEEIFAVEHMFDGKNGRSYTGESKGKYLPSVGLYDANSGNVTWLESMDGELANDVEVTVIMQAYAAKPNNGFGLQAVIVHGDIRYFGKTPLTPTLNKYSMFNITSEPKPRADTASPDDDVPTPDEDMYAGTMPPPAGGQPVPPPVGSPYVTQPQAAPGAPAGYYPGPGAQQQPAPAGYYPGPGAQQQQAPAQQTPPPAPQQQPQPQPAPAYPGAGPFTPAGYPPVDNQGIAYDPSTDPNRQY